VQNKMRLCVLVVTASLTTACLQIEGVHVLHPYGETDTGGYRIAMNAFTYGALNGDNTYSDMLAKLRRFSRPTTRFDGDRVYLQDVTSTAAMERMYDTYGCEPAPVAGYMDCRFALAMNPGDTPGWSLDWDVVVPSGIQVLSSNHHRTRRANGQDHLIWFFDGNRVSSASVAFTIRTPRAR